MMRCIYHISRSEDNAWELIKTLLLRYKQTDSDPTVLLHQTPESTDSLCELVPGLRTMFPLVSCPANQSDSTYPAIGWYVMLYHNNNLSFVIQ